MRAVLQRVRRAATAAASAPREAGGTACGRMSAWQVHAYGDLSELTLISARQPHVNAPRELLVRVDAASVNPIDVAMINGYGSRVFNMMRDNDNVEFPLTLGRDFAGTVEWCGVGVKDMEPGTRVWGVLPPHWQGSHAELTVAKRDWVAPQPPNLTAVEASSILYAGLTAWSGLWLTANLGLRGARGKRILVLGAAGGVGSIAVQILRAAGAFVICSCSADALPLVQSLGADMILDRKHAEYETCLKKYGPYDVILDCAGLGAAEAHSHDWEYSSYVTFTTPLLRDTDTKGLIPGTISSAIGLMCTNARAIAKARTVRWAYFVPSTAGIEHLQRLVETNKLRPIIEHVYGFDEVPEAYKRVQDGHLRGKVVIDFNKTVHT